MYHFYNSCVCWDRDDVHCTGGLCDMIDGNREITRRTFLRHTFRDDVKTLESELGYDRYFPITQDWAVSYHKSKLHGKTVYYLRHSSIEYVFAMIDPNIE